jgi:hypothetical protein
MVIHTQFLQSDICPYTHILQNMETLVGQEKQKIGTAVTAMREGKLSACHFGHVGHRFARPALECYCMALVFN